MKVTQKRNASRVATEHVYIILKQTRRRAAGDVPSPLPAPDAARDRTTCDLRSWFGPTNATWRDCTPSKQPTRPGIAAARRPEAANGLTSVISRDASVRTKRRRVVNSVGRSAPCPILISATNATPLPGRAPAPSYLHTDFVYPRRSRRQHLHASTILTSTLISAVPAKRDLWFWRPALLAD